ncbi:MAG: ComF family protein [Siphonobacter sp.]
MKSYLSAFWALLFPRTCMACREVLAEGEDTICTNCLFELPLTNSIAQNDDTVALKFAGKIPIESTHAYLRFRKGGRVQQLMHQLKYEGHQEVGELLGRMFGAELKKAGFAEQVDLLIPVPIHESRLRQRGYNQSDSIARGVSERLQVSWSNEVLRKELATESQTRKSRIERFQNVANVFQVIRPELIKNQRVALIDDVVTTGSTLESCAQSLLASGCSGVHIWTLATAM